jgi:hypothetical protein
VHCLEHDPYYDIRIPPEALEIIKQKLDSTPPVIAQYLRLQQKEWQNIKTYQVRHVWKGHNRGQWWRNGDQLESANILLSEYAESIDKFELEAIEGVIALGFGLKQVAGRLTGIVEVGLDATCKFP